MARLPRSRDRGHTYSALGVTRASSRNPKASTAARLWCAGGHESRGNCGRHSQFISRPLPPPAHPQKPAQGAALRRLRRGLLRGESVHHRAPEFVALIPGPRSQCLLRGSNGRVGGVPGLPGLRFPSTGSTVLGVEAKRPGSDIDLTGSTVQGHDVPLADVVEDVSVGVDDDGLSVLQIHL